MKNYNNVYRNHIYNEIQKLIKKGLTPEKAITKCSESLYCLLFSLNMSSGIFENINSNAKRDKVLEMMLVSILYIDLIKFLNAQIIDSDELSPILKSKYDLMINCESYEEVLDIFKKNFNILHLAVDCVYEMEEKSAFMKIIYANILDAETNNKILSIFPNYQEDIDKYNFKIDKEYVINKINQMYKSNVSFELVLCDLMAFIAWVKYGNSELYDELVKDMVNDTKKFIDEIDEKFDTSEFGELLGNFLDKPINATIDKFDEDEANIRYGITAFICEETDYRKQCFGEQKKI